MLSDGNVCNKNENTKQKIKQLYIEKRLEKIMFNEV